MNFISLIGVITSTTRSYFGSCSKRYKKKFSLFYNVSIGLYYVSSRYRFLSSALFHLITHAYSKALLFWDPIHYSFNGTYCWIFMKKSNMALMGGLRRYVPITRTTFYWGTLSICGIPPLACFGPKDEILNDSCLYSPIFTIIACFTVRIDLHFICLVYLLTFDGHLHVHFQDYCSTKIVRPIQYLYGKGGSQSSQ
ncbi:unnamed protein product [Musa acuminata subsp. burmannicoides]